MRCTECVTCLNAVNLGKDQLSGEQINPSTMKAWIINIINLLDCIRSDPIHI